MAGAVAPPAGAGVKDAPPAGRTVVIMASIVVIVSSTLALSMAHLFRSGYPYQCTVLALQQLVCTVFASVAMSWNPEEAAKLRISQANYVTMLLPFSGVLSLKLFLQNKAVQSSPPRSTP